MPLVVLVVFIIDMMVMVAKKFMNLLVQVLDVDL
jgi:hypothetical protein